MGIGAADTEKASGAARTIATADGRNLSRRISILKVSETARHYSRSLQQEK